MDNIISGLFNLSHTQKRYTFLGILCTCKWGHFVLQLLNTLIHISISNLLRCYWAASICHCLGSHSMGTRRDLTRTTVMLPEISCFLQLKVQYCAITDLWGIVWMQYDSDHWNVWLDMCETISNNMYDGLSKEIALYCIRIRRSYLLCWSMQLSLIKCKRVWFGLFEKSGFSFMHINSIIVFFILFNYLHWK